MPTETITIATDAGHDLHGSLELPTGLVRGAALFAHCFTCTKQSKAAMSVARALAKEGVACLRFDFTGLGGSGGEFGRAGFATDVADLVAAGEELLDRFAQPILMVGHSLGGAAVLAAADDLGFDKIAAIATIGGTHVEQPKLGITRRCNRVEGEVAAVVVAKGLFEPDQLTWRAAIVGRGLRILSGPLEQDRVVRVTVTA